MNHIRLAKQTDGAWGGGVDWTWEELERFTKLVAAHEREECAKLCDYYYKSWIDIEGRYEFMGEGAQECAEAIRARGEA